MRMFVTIANKQINTNAILGVDPKPDEKQKTNRLKLYLDPRISPLLAGQPGIANYVAGSADRATIIELVGEYADAFRKEWQQQEEAKGGASMSAGR